MKLRVVCWPQLERRGLSPCSPTGDGRSRRASRTALRVGVHAIFASVWALVVALPAADAANSAPQQQLGQWLAELRKSPGIYARFTEKKTMALLAAPLVSEGELFYAAPNLLARSTRKPEATVVVLDGEQLRVYDGRAWQVIDMAGKPLVRQFAQSFVGILRGDFAQLTAQYRLDWRPATAQQVQWQLTLWPKQPPLAKLIARLELVGRGLGITSMRMVEVNGDETLTLFSDIDPARSYSKAEQASGFAALRH